MSDRHLRPVSDLDELRHGQAVVLEPKSSHVEYYVDAFYQSHDAAMVFAVIKGSGTPLPFPHAEWAVLVEPTYPMPSVSDIATLIHNGIVRSNAGESVSYGDIAQDIQGLMTGDTKTPVEAISVPNPIPVQAAPDDLPEPGPERLPFD